MVQAAASGVAAGPRQTLDKAIADPKDQVS